MANFQSIIKLKIFHYAAVFFCILIAAFCITGLAKADGGATIYLTPASESFSQGSTFSIDLMIDTGSTTINAAQTDLIYPSDMLEIVKVSKDNSVFSMWPQEPSYSNTEGKLSVVGGLPNPGFSGIGNLVTIEFKAKQTGQATISLQNAKILANDGLGTNILQFIKNSKYLIYNGAAGWPLANKNSIIFSPTHPNESEWYNNDDPHLDWQLPDDALGVSFSLDQASDTLPQETSEGRVTSAEYKKIPDGIWYFHLRFETSKGWSEPISYKLQIDTKPPEAFNIIIDNNGDPTNPKPDLYFKTEDQTSGISQYGVKIDDNSFINLMTAQVSELLSPGIHHILVEASDKADNIASAETQIDVEPIASPQISIMPKSYAAGDENLYIAGTSLPGTQVTLLLKQDGKVIKKWQVESSDQGNWNFSTKELIKPGSYTLSAIAQDNRGAQSLETSPQNIKITFSGLRFGDIMITLRNLIILLLCLLVLAVLFGVYLIIRNRRMKKKLKKETVEAKDSLLKNFYLLEKELKTKIEMFDSQPGFNKQEKKVYESLMTSLIKSRRAIEKEIADIENKLK